MRSKLFLAVILTLVSPVIALSAGNSLKKGAWALQFEIGDRLDLSSFQGTTISIKKHHSEKTAFRLGLTTNIGLSSSDNSSSPNDSTTYNDHDNYTSVDLSVVIQRIHYPHPHAAANFFWGLGPRVDLSYRNDHRKTTQYGDSTTQSYENRSTAWSIGISGVLGVEWFAAPSVSILAEYGSSALYTFGNGNRSYTFGPNSGNDSETSTNSFSFKSSAVRFGLSVYF